VNAPTVRPGIKNSAQVRDVPESPEADGPVLVETLAALEHHDDVKVVLQLGR